MTEATPASHDRPLPLAGIRVVEFVHMVMGPSCGLVLGDLGADVIKVEPVGGDNTRKLRGSGAGFFVTFNRNKRSLAVDVKSPAGREVVERLLATADALTENFRPGAMAKLGLDYASLKERLPALIYCSLKGFLPGPYEHRAALDEVVQMMGGLAYMTGPPGRPLRAGSSVNDIMGGMFAAIGILSALRQRDISGEGQHIQSALYENNALLVAQHMTQYAITGQAAAPMPNRLSAWGIYDVFETRDDNQIFIGVVSDTQWKLFCDTFERPDLFADERLTTNVLRVDARPWLHPIIAELFRAYAKAELMAICERIGLPYAPITRPEELYDDPQLRDTGGLLETRLPGSDRTAGVPALPLSMGGSRFGLRRQPPRVGENTRELLLELGYEESSIAALLADGIVVDSQ